MQVPEIALQDARIKELESLNIAISIEKHRISELSSLIKSRFTKKNELYNYEDFCLFLSTKNVTSDGFKFDENQYISKEKDCILRNGKLERGDIVITTRGTIGNIAYYDSSIPFDNVRINSGMVILRRKGIIFNPLFFIFAFKSKITEILSKATGAAQPQLPIRIMGEIMISNPPIELQNKFASFVEQIDKLKFNCQQRIKLYQELLDKKMDEYFG